MPKKKELTDEEWAELVAAKVSDRQRLETGDSIIRDTEDLRRKRAGQPPVGTLAPFHGQLEQPDAGVDVTPGKPTITERKPAEVDVQIGDPTRMVTVKSRDEDAMGRTRAEADQETAREVLKKVAGDAGSGSAQAAAESSGPMRPGVIYLANTGEDGQRTKGQMVARKMFKSDGEFDAFVKRAQEQGNLWDEESDREQSGSPSNPFKAFVASLIPGAVPSNGKATAEVENARKVFAGASEGLEPTAKAAPQPVELARPAGGVPIGQAPEDKPYEPPAKAPGALDRLAGLDRMHGGAEGWTDPQGNNNFVPSNSVESTTTMSNAPMPLTPGSGMPPPVGAPTPVAPTGGNSSSGMSAQIPIRANAEKFPPAQNQNAAMQAAIDQQKAAILGAADVESTRQQAAANMADQQSQALVKQQQKMQGMQEYQEQRSQELMNTVMEANRVLSSPAQTPDPERYWNSHSKVMFAIGVGLLAQAGRDTSAIIGSVNQAIGRDIEAQKAEFEAPKNAARAKAAGAQQIYGMLRQAGHDAFEAEKMAAAIGADVYAQQVLKLAANSQSQEVKLKAQAMAAELQQHGIKAMTDADNHARTNAVAEYNARTNRMEADLKLKQFQKESGPGKGKILPSGEAEKLGKLKTAIDSIRDLSGQFDKVSGSVLGAAGSKISSNIPRTEAANYDKRRSAFLRTIGLLVDESVLQKHDQEAWEGLLPKSGDLNGGESLRALLDNAMLKLKDKTQAYGSAGYDISGFGQQSQGSQLQTRQGPGGKTFEKRADGLWYPQGS